MEEFGRYAKDPALAGAALASPEVMYVRGTVPDPDALDYLVDLAGVAQFLLDHGGVAVLDMQSLSWFSPME